MAGPSAVVITEAVRVELPPGGNDMTALGAGRLKGIGEPVTLFELR
jgi:class 3 adenylate cyclase